MSKPQTITIELTRKEVERIKVSLMTRAMEAQKAADLTEQDGLSGKRQREYRTLLMDLYNNKFEGTFS